LQASAVRLPGTRPAANSPVSMHPARLLPACDAGAVQAADRTSAVAGCSRRCGAGHSSACCGTPPRGRSRPRQPVGARRQEPAAAFPSAAGQQDRQRRRRHAADSGCAHGAQAAGPGHRGHSRKTVRCRRKCPYIARFASKVERSSKLAKQAHPVVHLASQPCAVGWMPSMAAACRQRVGNGLAVPRHSDIPPPPLFPHSEDDTPGGQPRPSTGPSTGWVHW
jgi:hypothetical protein